MQAQKDMETYMRQYQVQEQVYDRQQEQSRGQQKKRNDLE